MLESENAEAITKLVGVLQTRRELRSFDFSVARATREHVQGELVADVLTAFQARARLIAESLGGGGYAIDEVSLETNTPTGPRPMTRMRAQSTTTAPAVEGGSSRVTVTARGAIILE